MEISGSLIHCPGSGRGASLDQIVLPLKSRGVKHLTS